VREYADLLGVKAMFSSTKFDENRRINEKGQKVYSLWDAYPHADLVTYPSAIEGFGNAFLEALYFNKPIVVNNYAIYETDIKPKGFKVIDFNEYITDETVEAARKILLEPQLAEEMCKYNYKLALKHYSYKVLRSKLRALLSNAFGINHMP
jgi:mannosylglucosylglycerate synthase